MLRRKILLCNSQSRENIPGWRIWTQRTTCPKLKRRWRVQTRTILLIRKWMAKLRRKVLRTRKSKSLRTFMGIGKNPMLRILTSKPWEARALWLLKLNPDGGLISRPQCPFLTLLRS
jgi:hypothetical protein